MNSKEINHIVDYLKDREDGLVEWDNYSSWAIVRRNNRYNGLLGGLNRQLSEKVVCEILWAGLVASPS